MYFVVTSYSGCGCAYRIGVLPMKSLPVMRLARNIFISVFMKQSFGFGRDRAYDVIVFLNV
jgi:hypothetical protein